MFINCPICHFNYEPNVFNTCPNCIKDDPLQLAAAWNNAISFATDTSGPMRECSPCSNYETEPHKLYETEYHKLVDSPYYGYDDWDSNKKEPWYKELEENKKAQGFLNWKKELFEEFLLKKGSDNPKYDESFLEKEKRKKAIEDLAKWLEGDDWYEPKAGRNPATGTEPVTPKIDTPKEKLPKKIERIFDFED